MGRAFAHHGRDALAGLGTAGVLSVQVVCHTCWHRGVLQTERMMGDETGEGLSPEVRCCACLSPDVDLSPNFVEYEID